MSDDELMDDGPTMEESPPGRRRPAADDDDDDGLDVTNRPGLAVRAFAAGCAPDLLPGSQKILERQFGVEARDGGLRNLVNYLNDKDVEERFMHPERPQPNISPLRQMIRRFEHAGLLRKGAADELFDAIAVDPRFGARAMRDDAGKVAALVWEELHALKPERRDLWHSHAKPQLPHHVAKVLSAIEALAIPVVGAEDLAMKWSDAGGRGRTWTDVVRAAATRLKMAGYEVPESAIGRAVNAEPAPPTMTPFQEELIRLGRASDGYEVM